MKKTTLKLSILAIAGIFAAVSCSKTQSTHDKFVGSWKTHTVVLDTNNNGTLDATDLTMTVDTSNQIIKLNSDNTGSSSSKTNSAKSKRIRCSTAFCDIPSRTSNVFFLSAMA